MKKAPFRHHHWEVEQQPGRFRVRHIRTGQVFFVELRIIDRRREIGPCSCGRPASDVPIYFCPHQTAAYKLIGAQWLANLPKRLPFEHPERLTPEFLRNQERLMATLRRQARPGHLTCPHCQCRITAADFEPDRQKPGERLRQSAFPFLKTDPEGGRLQ